MYKLIIMMDNNAILLPINHSLYWQGFMQILHLRGSEEVFGYQQVNIGVKRTRQQGDLANRDLYSYANYRLHLLKLLTN